MMAKDKEHLLAAAREEKDVALRKAAVELLGILKAQKELEDLYRAETDATVKKNILEAMFIGGDAERLIDLAQQEKDPALRGEAVGLLGTMGAEKAGGGLVALYHKEQDKKTRRKILDALFTQGNAKAMVEIARRETDPGLKKKLVEDLAAMKSKDASDYLMELLTK
jgi:HEAT repeat protein